MAKLKDLKVQNPNTNINLIDIMRSYDPSKTNKYIPFMIKLFEDIDMSNQAEALIYQAINKIFENKLDKYFKLFERYQNSKHITKKDINEYESDEFLELCEKLESMISESEIKDEQTIQIVNNDNVSITIPLTQMSMDMYGSNSKWCLISGKNTTFSGSFNYWDTKMYIILNFKNKNDIRKVRNFKCFDNNTLIGDYNKVRNLETAFVKFAIQVERGQIEIWDAEDKKVGSGVKAHRIFTDLLIAGFINENEYDELLSYVDTGKSSKRLSQEKGIPMDIATKSLPSKEKFKI